MRGNYHTFSLAISYKGANAQFSDDAVVSWTTTGPSVAYCTRWELLSMADLQVIPGHKKPIVTATIRCVHAFNQALDHPHPLVPDFQLRLSNERDRLKVWAGSLGVLAGHHGDADHVLEQQSNVVDAILVLIRRVIRLLGELSAPPGKQLPSPPVTLHRSPSTGSSSQSETDTENSSSDSFVLEEPVETSAPDQAMRLVKGISDAITNLHRLNAMLKKSDPARERRRVQEFERDCVDQEELEDLRSFARWQLLRWFPGLESQDHFLVKRLVEALSFQRAKIAYRRRHREKRSLGVAEAFRRGLPSATGEWQEQSGSTMQTQVPAESAIERKVPEQVTERVAYSETAPSYVNRLKGTIYPKSIAASQLTQAAVARRTQLDVPPAPKIDPNVRESTCPYCSQVIRREDFVEPRWT